MYLFIILKKCFIHNKGDILKIRQHWLGHRNYNHTKSSSRIFSLRLCLMHWHFAEVYVITSLHMAIKIVIDLPWILNKSKMYKSITKELSLSPNILEFSLIICDELMPWYIQYLHKWIYHLWTTIFYNTYACYFSDWPVSKPVADVLVR